MFAVDPQLRDLHAMLNNLAERRGLARMLFGGGQALDLTNPAIVFAASGMTLPDKEKDSADWMPEEIAGMALLYLVAAITGDSLMRDPRFGVAIFDEAYFLTGNPHGLELLIKLARDGRKHGAALWLLAHDAADLADETLRGLFAYRFVGRMETASAARRALEFLGAAATDANIQALQELNDPAADDLEDEDGEPEKGEFFFRDALARIALIRVLADWNAARHEAFRTDLLRDEVAA
jgi:AAA-like domain